MKKTVLFLFLLFVSVSHSQELLMDTEDVHPADVIEPKFNGGGIEKFYEFVTSEFDNSKVAKAGKLIATFTISEEGDMKNVRIVKFPNEEAAAEIIRVIRKAPKWEPAKRGGKPFSTDIKFPLEFK
jgi:hypothetical protein